MTLAWEGREGGQTDVGAPTFDELYDAHRQRAFRLALLLCGGERPLAEDALSEAFIRVYPRWRGGHVDDFGPYLRRAVVNEVKRMFTRRGLQRRSEPPLEAEAVTVTSPEDHVVRRQLVWDALQRLPVKQRTAFVLRYYEGLPVEEVASAMGTSVGTAKSHLSRGRDLLRTLLEEQL
ncbi:MAG: SigE family RNA polymerase sigma factor [Acidimicrobiia bacterium]|nr:SigE family RNA polymerase sigma factor [Acidimicrobiia bacterium]